MHFCGSVQIENVVFNLANVKSVYSSLLYLMSNIFHISNLCLTKRLQMSFESVCFSTCWFDIHPSVTESSTYCHPSCLSSMDRTLRTLENTLTRMAAWLLRLVSQLPTTRNSPERIVFQPTVLRGYVSFRDGIHKRIWKKMPFDFQSSNCTLWSGVTPSQSRLSRDTLRNVGKLTRDLWEVWRNHP